MIELVFENEMKEYLLNIIKSMKSFIRIDILITTTILFAILIKFIY